MLLRPALAALATAAVLGGGGPARAQQAEPTQPGTPPPETMAEQGLVGVAGWLPPGLDPFWFWGGLAAAGLLGLLIFGLWLRRRVERSSYARLLGSAPAPRQVVDRRGRQHYANPSFQSAFGNRRVAMPEMLRDLLADPLDAARLEELSASAAAGEGGNLVLALSPRALLSDPGLGREERRRRWITLRAQPLGKTRSGQARDVLWAIDLLDLAEPIETAMRSEQERFVSLFDHAPIGYYSLDSEGRVLFSNSTLAMWLGLDPTEMVGLRLADVIAEERPPGTAPWDPFGDSAQRSGEVRLRSASGKVFVAFVNQELVSDREGRFERTRSVVRHLTQERAMSEALARSEQRFEHFFQEAPIGIALLNGEAKLLESNAAMRQLAGASDEFPAGTTLFDLVAPEQQMAVRAALELVGRMQAAEDGSPPGASPPVEVTLAWRGAPAAPEGTGGPAAEGRACALFLTRMESARGAGGYVAHFLDVTEQKVLEAQFAQSQKMQAVGQLAGGIAHDFNNLLTAMIGFSDLLLLRHRPGDQSFADVMQIKQNANRAANLVRQLLAFSRQQTLRPRVLDVTDILAELSHLLRRLIGENIELKMSHGRDLGAVKADQGQLEQVIINLAVNARDAMPGGGQLTIRTGNVVVEREFKQKGEVMPAGDYTCIEVTDSGTGIDPKNLDRIFEPFFSTKEVGAGTGLGLSTVYGIVKQSGGFVFVDSELGVGSTFSVYLPHFQPSAEEVEVAQAVREESRDLSGIGTVLLVEDEDGVRSFSARALRNKGYEVLEARSGDAALEVLAESGKPVDLLITDVVMPKVDGPTLVREVRETRPDLKVIFISGYTEDSFRQRIGEDAGIHFLPKPFSLKQLAGKVKEVMREGSA